MIFNIQTGTLIDTNLSNRRLHGRMGLEMVACDLGPVIDLSATGMRVEASKAPRVGRPIQVILFDHSGSMLVRAKVEWAKKCGFRRCEIGLSFVGVDDETRSLLTRIAMINSVRRTIV